MRSVLFSACLLALTGIAGASSYTNDYTSLTNIYPLSVAGAPFMDASGTAVNTTTVATGYSMLQDIPVGSGPALNITGNKFMTTVKYDGPAQGAAVFWFRIWNGKYDGGPYQGWSRTRRPAYAGIGRCKTGWQTFTHDVMKPQDLQYYDSIFELDVSSVFAFSQGTQFWSEAEVPYTWGMHYLQCKPDLDRQIKGISLGDYSGPVWIPDKDEARAMAGIVGPKFGVEIRVVPAGGNPDAPVETVYPVILDGGQCYAGTVTPPGTYDLYIAAVKPDLMGQIQYHWLNKKVSNVVFGATGAVVNAPLANGDIDLDGMVTVFDYNALSAAFDMTSDNPDWDTPDPVTFIKPSECDLDGDGAITVFDYNTLSANFDMVGDF